MNCAFLVHMGNGSCSPNNNAVKYCDTLKNQSQHIDKVIDKQTLEKKIEQSIALEEFNRFYSVFNISRMCS
jgi:hypothetical protein